MTERRAVDIVDALGESEIFGALYEDELKELARLGTTVRYPSGRTLFERGDPGDSLMVVLDGRVKISSLSAEGREVVLNFIDPGQVLGEIALLDGKPRTAGATTLEPTELFVLKRQAVLGFLEEQPLVAIRLIGVLCQKLRRTTQMLEDKLLLNMAPRVARGLLRLAAEHGRRTAEGVLIDMKLSQSDLGAYVGLSRENVNRQLSAWRDGGIVDLRGGRVLIRAPKDLEALAGEPV
jgi:CRP/FNR family transcriptional regulator, cyclic AMP receptor protein